MDHAPQSTASQQQADLIDRERLLASVQALQPLLLRNVAATEHERRAAEENIQALQRAGVFRTMVPRRYGGCQGSIRTHLEVTAAVAEACAGTAWVVALTNVCAWFTGLFGAQAQDDVFGADPDARVAGVFAPSGEVRREAGGLRVSGKWFWSSGSLHASWALLGVLETDADGQTVDQYMALMPMSELSIDDTWYTVGMRGSGSNCVVARDVFVPEHRLLSMSQAIEGRYPTPYQDEATYRAAFVPVAALVLIGAQLGIGRAALRHVIGLAPKRAIAYTSFKRQSDSAVFQLNLAKAAMKIDSAHLHAFRAADAIDQLALQGQTMDYVTRARTRADSGWVAQQVTEALDTLITCHGAGTFAESNPLQRHWRDSNTAARHAVILQPISEEVYGKALLGVENDVTTLV